MLTMHLARIVSYGHSFESANDIYNLLEKYPLQHTHIHLMRPQRNSLPIPEPQASSQLSTFHLVGYNSKMRMATAKFHSQYSVDVHFEADKIEGLKKQTKKNSKRASKNNSKQRPQSLFAKKIGM